MDVATGGEWSESYLGADNIITGVNQWPSLKKSSADPSITDAFSPRTDLLAFYEPVAAVGDAAGYNASVFIFKDEDTGEYFKFNLNLETFPTYDVLAEYTTPTDILVNYQCAAAGGDNVYDIDTSSTYRNKWEMTYTSTSSSRSSRSSSSSSSSSSSYKDRTNYIASMELRASAAAEYSKESIRATTVASGTSFALHVVIVSGLLLLVAAGCYAMYKSYGNGKRTPDKEVSILDEAVHGADYGTYLEERDAESDPLL